MKIYGERELGAARGLGGKALLRRALLAGPVNALALGLARPWATRFPRLRRLPVAAAEVAYRLGSGEAVVLVAPAACDVAKDVYWGRGQRCARDDQHVLRLFEALAARSEICVDIGSYSGLFTLVAARASATIACHAYEILPEVYLLLLRNLVRNDLVVRCRANLCGLGAGPGEVVMPTTLSGSVLPSSLSLGSRFADGVRIPVTTLDREFHGVCGARILVKIDVEGFEADVFAGGEAFFRDNRPDIVCEVLPGADAGDRITAQLAPLGYRFAQFSADGLRERPAIAPSRAGKDWLLTTRDPASLSAWVPIAETAPP
jgi:FkbM family methyltransferase